MRTCLFYVVALAAAPTIAAPPYRLHQFERRQLTDTYYSEGANAGDINGDGQMDVVHGPYWFAGPDFQTRHEIYPAKAQNRQAYADNFFSWVYDFDGDKLNDVFSVGFPGTPAYVYKNPGHGGWDKTWPKFEVFDWVSNESPHFTNLVGDERPELVCTRDGFFGYAVIDPTRPLEPWKFHAISEQVADRRFGHGLGVGDIDGDGRLDVITKDGWFQQPKSLAGAPKWKFHSVPFARAGGAEMYAYDVDGDGDNDVITSLAAHEFGLAWHEQLRADGKITFRQHLIMGSKPAENRYGLVFSELHTVALADMDGDGLKDIVTGKTYWSHHTQSPMWDAGAVVYWFKLVRGPEGVDWVPYQADGEAGVGRQLVIADLNNDMLPDIVVGGMKGCHVLLHAAREVDEAQFRAAQPRPRMAMKAGLPPLEAAAHMTVPPGFKVQLAAGEPMVHQPVAMAFDPKGRLWVAEAYTYPTRAPEGQGVDKIIILEDADQDGDFDQRKVFADGLNLVSGLELGFGGVWVGAAPYLLFIPDKDGDDVPDGEPRVLLDGFGYQDTHETLNGFIWGPDGWLYGCHGVFTHSRVGKPGTPDKDRIPLNAAIWRYHPVKHRFEIFAEGTSNPWGVDFNDEGQAFCTACVIPHLYHVIQGARYQRQAGAHFNPYTFDDIKTIADHLHYAGNIGDHAWWGHEPESIPDSVSAAGGGHAHCGAMIYLGDNWPAEYRNRIFMNNIHGNRVNCDLLKPKGSGFVGSHGPDLLLANDHWFRGINLRYGPDGSVYLIDWYDKNACHRVNPQVHDRSNGRIYRISYGDCKPVKVDLGSLAPDELLKLTLHKNEWYVRMARRLLQQGSHARAGKPPLIDEMYDANLPRGTRLRALWTRHVLHCNSESDWHRLFGDSDEYLRGWAIQLALEDHAPSPETLARLLTMAKEDPSPVVRRYLASALQRLALENRWAIAEALVQHGEDAHDHNLPLLYWYGTEPLVPGDPARALALARQSKIELVTRFIVRRAAMDAQGLDAVVAAVAADENPARQSLFLQEVLRAFEGRVNIPAPPSWGAAYEQLLKTNDAAVRDRADQIAVILGDKRILPRMRQLLADAKAPLEKRQAALEILLRGRDAEAAPALIAVLRVPELRGAAIRALSAYDDARTPPALIAVYGELSDTEKRDAISTLVSRPAHAEALLDAIAAGKLPRTDLHAYHIRQLLAFNNKALGARIAKEWGAIRETAQDKKQQIEKLKGFLTEQRLANADAGNGRRLFVKACASCHTLFGEGQKVGPDITGSNRANLDYILENIVDPSAVLGNDYRMTVLRTSDGRIVQGLVQKETDSALTLRTPNDTVVVAKADIEEQSLSELSLMPDRLLEQFTEDEICDLVAYLRSPAQVPLKGPPSPIDPQTRKVPGALEGESLAVIGKTQGSAGGQNMSPFPKDRWSGDHQLWWTGARPGSKLVLELPVEKEGDYGLELVLTKARDYGIVQLYLDEQKLGEPLDLYNFPDVIHTGVLSFPPRKLAAGKHRLTVEITGAHPQAVKAYMFGLDYVRLVPVQAAGAAQ